MDDDTELRRAEAAFKKCIVDIGTSLLEDCYSSAEETTVLRDFETTIKSAIDMAVADAVAENFPVEVWKPKGSE